MNTLDPQIEQKPRNAMALKTQQTPHNLNAIGPHPPGPMPPYYQPAQPVNHRMNANPMLPPIGLHPTPGNNQLPPPVHSPMTSPFPPPLPEGNNLKMKVDDAFLPTEDIPIFEVSMQKVKKYDEKLN